MTRRDGMPSRKRGTGAHFAAAAALPADICVDCGEPAVVGLGAPPERLCMAHFESRLSAIGSVIRAHTGRGSDSDG